MDASAGSISVREAVRRDVYGLINEVLTVNVRFIGLVAASLFVAYGYLKYSRGKSTKIDLLLALLIAGGIVTVSIFPQVLNTLASTFRLDNRLFALLVFSNLVLLGMFFYLLNLVRAASRRSGDIVRAFARHAYNERSTARKAAAARSQEGASGTIRKKMLVVIPAYNEEEAIRGVLARIPRELLGYEVETLVVVDGATDGTEAVAIEHDLPVVTHIINLGQGDALRTGFEVARIEGVDIVVNLDADGQHRPEEIERLVRPILDDKADYVMGSRFLGSYEEAGGIRHKGIVLFSRLASTLSGHKITDITNGFRAIRGSEIYKLDLREDRFNAAELLMEAVKKKLRVKEVPISILRRAEGESKKPRRLGYPLGFLRVIVQTWLR